VAWIGLTEVVPQYVAMEPLASPGLPQQPWGFTSAPIVPVSSSGNLATAWQALPEEAAAPEDFPLQPLQPPLQAPQQLPPLQHPHRQAEGLRSLRSRAEHALMAPAAAAVPARRAAAAAAVAEAAAASATAPQLGPTEEERQQRSAHLRRQRDRLIQKRAAERQRQLEQFQYEKTAQAAARGIDSSAANEPEQMAAGRRLVAELTPGAVVANPAMGRQTDTAAADRMRQALTAQLRSTLARSAGTNSDSVEARVSQLEGMRGGGSHGA